MIERRPLCGVLSLFMALGCGSDGSSSKGEPSHAGGSAGTSADAGDHGMSSGGASPAGGTSGAGGATGGAGGKRGMGGSKSGAGGTAGVAGAGGAKGGAGGIAGSASGGAGATGGNSAGGAGGHIVGACDDLPAKGTWQETTPAAVKAKFAEQEFGVIAMAVNPQNPATVYFGTHQIGIWKSTNCGSTWVHINTGQNGSVLDGGFQWSVAIDPVNPEVLYANSGYSTSNGAWKSTNGGVDWSPLWPPADGSLAGVVQYDLVHKIRIDPSDHTHLLISFHTVCAAPYANACLAESKDSGKTWKLVNGDPSWTGAEDQTVWFLDNSQTWLYASQSNGMWRTSDGGQTWKLIDATFGGHNGGQLYRTQAGVYYQAGPAGLLRSPDGIKWSRIESVGTGMIGVTGSGRALYASHGPYAESPAYLPYHTSPETDGQQWTELASPMLSTGGYELAYDPDHHVLYSTNATAGFWRVVID